MRKLLLFGALIAALVPVAAQASPPANASGTAGQVCAALKVSMGASFSQAYRTFGACVSAHASLDQANAASAAAACRAEQADAGFAGVHGKTFDQFYGTGKNGRNAFGKCVSTKAQASSEAESAAGATPNPAQTCRAERAKMGLDDFDKTYGANGNHRNAFGKCVSKAAQAEAAAEQNAAAACRAEQADTDFAGAHGKPFDQFYGTNANFSNAFGKCVSTKARAAAAAQVKAMVSAVRACRAERNAGAAAFRQKYGTFGHCVSLSAKNH